MVRLCTETPSAGTVQSGVNEGGVAWTYRDVGGEGVRKVGDRT
jgi:hypothetical protein